MVYGKGIGSEGGMRWVRGASGWALRLGYGFGVVRGLFALVCLLCLHSLVAGQPCDLDTVRGLMSRGMYVEAQGLLERGVKSDSCPDGRLLLARVLLARQQGYDRVVGLTDQGGREALFLRAEGLRGLYRFEEAREYYLQYLAQPIADRQMAALAHRRLAECQNAQQLMGAVYAPRLVRRSAVHRDSILSEVSSVSSSYQWIHTPSALQSEYDRALGATLMAYPRRISQGDRLFFVSRRGAGEGLDIHFVRKLEGDLWTRPEPVGFLLNSQQGEAMPLLSEDGTTLYFSSEGHYGMGGMDIFRSRWDGGASRWLPPENLGFPFNSPYDDYLLSVPSGSGQMVLASNRGMAQDSLGVYYLDYDPGVPGVPLRGSDRMERYASFIYGGGGAASGPGLGTLRASDVSVRVGDASQRGRAGGRQRSVESDPEYQSELSAGHRYQQRADTLREQLTKYREQLWDVRTQEERRMLEAKIAPVEQGMLAAQRKADTHFANASIIEQEYIVGKRTLSSTVQGRPPYADDLPTHLHGARMAHTAFQSDELAALARSFSHLSTFESEARAIVTLRRSVGGDASRSQSIELLAAGFTRRYEETVERVRSLYAECLSVALMKSQRHDGALAQEAERVAQEKGRLASALRHNQDTVTRWRSSFDALLLDALGLWHYERAYAHIWGMRAYLDRLSGRIALYDSLVSSSMDGLDAEHFAGSSGSDSSGVSVALSSDRMVSFSAAESGRTGLWVESISRYTHGTAIPRDEALRRGVVYKLQLGAYSNPIDPEIFRGMVPISAETLNGGRITKYYAGDFSTKSAADAGKQVAAQCGFPDAFVVAWYDGRSVPIARAQGLEGESVKRAIAEKSSGKALVASGGVQGYRVVVGVFAAGLPPYVSETLSLLAPGREVAKQPTEDGQWRYSIPNMAERTQAERLRDNLLASGYTDARVEPMVP